MEQHDLVVNTIIEWFKTENHDAGLSRILWIDEKRVNVAIYMLTGKPVLPIVMEYGAIVTAIESQDGAICPFDPYSVPKLDDTEIDKTQLQIRNKNWEKIKDLVCDEPAIYFEESRAIRVREAVAKTGTQRKYIYKFLKRFWQRGMTKNALLPDYQNCGGFKTQKSSGKSKRGRPSKQGRRDPEKIGVNITDVDKALIRIAIDKYYDTKERNPIRRAYNLMIEKHYNKGYEIQGRAKVPITAPPEECPSYDQFYYWFNKFRNLEKSIKARKGERYFNLTSRPVLNESTHFAHGPGHIFQIDSTIADIYLLSMFLKTLIIGRPVLYFIVDVFSRLVAGLYVGLEGPSWIGAALALAVTAMNKVEFCARFGINIQPGTWPVHMLPQRLVADRGPEWVGKNSDKLINNFGTIVTNDPPYRADFKGIVEQEFHRAKESTIRWIPGSFDGRYRERGEKDHRRDATLTIPQFTEVLIRMIINYNNNHFIEDYPLLPEMIADGVKPVPIELWNWGMKNRTGYLQYRTQQEVMLGLMPTGIATVSWQGIEFMGLHYSCERAIKDNWYVDAGAKGSWKCKAYYNPRHLDRIYLLPNHEKEPIECWLLEKDLRFSGHYLEDLLEQQEIVKQMKEDQEHQERQGDAEQRAHTDEIIERAKEQNKLATEYFQSDKQSTLAIRKNRQIEKELFGKMEAFNPIADSPPQIGWNGESQNDKVRETSVADQSSVKRIRTLNMLKNRRKGGQ